MNELQQILEHIGNDENFLLSGGAGSGKTYSLVQVIKEVIKQHPAEKVFCMTYTNIAVKEIEERVNHKNLDVSTIHDFLWDNIKHFQKEIKASLIALANDPDSKIKIDNDGDPVPDNFFDAIKEIEYKEYLKINNGIISHDEVIWLSEYMFRTYIKLCDILKDKYRFIFVDEYQDTHKEVVDILLRHIRQSQRKNTIGFFGDAMQSIYSSGVDEINDYIEEGLIKEVKKEQNRRSPRLVIELANRLRTDGIVQEPSDDTKAPNMQDDGTVKEGTIKFIYSTNPDLDLLRDYLTENFGWDFNDNKRLKELNLTHNLIAEKAGFQNLMAIYDKDPIISLKSAITQKIKDDKKYGRPEIIFDENASFDTVVDIFQLKNRQRQLKKDIILANQADRELYDQLKDVPFVEVRKIYLDKDQLIDDKKQTEDEESKKGSKRDNLIKHLFKIQQAISLYQSGKFNEFLAVTDYKINRVQDKIDLKNKIESLINVEDKTIEEVINEADRDGICVTDDKLERFIREKEYVYNRVKKVKFSEFQKLFEYLEGRTPFTTQHKTKGDEFDNVLVILDNGDWTQYNFENLFLENGSESVLKRTQKLFYVCCTRTKENLVVFYHEPSEAVIEKAKEWFGEENVIEI
ncbi:AAA family ATPase [Sulfurovum sp. zt1-1]|uniref:AAA family ATPase n=1 Tax=Sulfurovum zhangzhouensis TaxID=3019067 RepID=A0ABT7QW57_9BACT|nr:UvrD-helicase domain-containing protein [Sulfurovum zhangzhouensis]MDM5270774.1 AAA family ATPase [Sulfurovum zhangzhouensis]